MVSPLFDFSLFIMHQTTPPVILSDRRESKDLRTNSTRNDS